MVSVTFSHCYTECHYAECRYPECLSTDQTYRAFRSVRIPCAVVTNLIAQIFQHSLYIFTMISMAFTCKEWTRPWNIKGGSITVLLTSCLTGLD
jgi:hypothetical protein